MRKFLVVLCSIFLGAAVIGGTLAFYIYTQLQPVASNKQNKIEFVIPQGQSVATIGQRLQSEGLIHNGALFRVWVWHMGIGQKIQAGSFTLSPNMSTIEIANQLTLGTNDVWIKVIEGWRREEIADMLDKMQLENFNKKIFLELSKNDEGYLFPDSYLVQKNADTEHIHNLLRDTFDKKVTKDLAPDIQQAQTAGHSLRDVMTMASIVQREARDATQMKIIASILWNRVNMNMGLQADPTLQYIRGYDSILKTWWAEPSEQDKLSGSLYNTYKYRGLPPGPICSPGLDAIQAALHPAQTDYLFYMHDRQGVLHYARTLQEHDANIQKYL